MISDDELRRRILQYMNSRAGQAVNKFNLLGRVGVRGELELSLGQPFENEERSAAYRIFEALRRKGLLIPTYSDLIDPENWVVITEVGKRFLAGESLPAFQPRSPVAAIEVRLAAPKVFLTHATSDASIAGYLKTQIEGMLLGVEVFRSTDPADLPPGARWSREIQNALQS
jgi:hypothetical protein